MKRNELKELIKEELLAEAKKEDVQGLLDLITRESPSKSFNRYADISTATINARDKLYDMWKIYEKAIKEDKQNYDSARVTALRKQLDLIEDAYLPLQKLIKLL